MGDGQYEKLQMTGVIIGVENFVENFHFSLQKLSKKVLAFSQSRRYNIFCCDMIAMKREVAALYGRFSVERMSS